LKQKIITKKSHITTEDCVDMAFTEAVLT